MRRGLTKTRGVFRRLLSARDAEEVEDLLLGADVGVAVTELLVEKVRNAGSGRLRVLEEAIAALLGAGTTDGKRNVTPPRVIMIVGVNGSGKTTAAGKLCHYFSRQGDKVVVAAADTYRDAAAAQLDVWAGRAAVEVVRSVKGQDAAAVAFDAVSKALRGYDTVLVDTAGRLHTRKDLMDEVVKVKRVCGKVKPGAPDDIWLVLDATVGQNGLHQARAFNERLGLTGLIVAKLDGTAKGGVVLPIVHELGLPVEFVGTGESLEDLERFDAGAFAKALFED